MSPGEELKGNTTSSLLFSWLWKDGTGVEGNWVLLCHVKEEWGPQKALTGILSSWPGTIPTRAVHVTHAHAPPSLNKGFEPPIATQSLPLPSLS